MKLLTNLTLGSIIVAFTATIFFSSCTNQGIEVHMASEPDAHMAAFNTDQYVWEKMVRAFQVKTQEPLNLDWELWSTTEYAYSDSCQGVDWPTKGLDLSLAPPKAVAILDNLNNHPGNFNVTDFAILTLNATDPYYEELRINKPMFDYIQEMGLYDQNTVYQLAKEGKINFPSEAMMIKAQWIPVDSSLVGSYYTKKITILVKDLKDSTQHIARDTLMGLVGFHLVTRELPNWVWSTFEYAGNPGLCDYIGCKDNFGCEPTYIPPKKFVNQGYEIGETTPALLALIKKFGVPEAFKNYRLKGSQTEYTDNHGDTLILGNSILEMNLVPTSSCISCHARATLNNGYPRDNLNMFIGDVATNLTPDTPTSTKGFHPLCYTGIPVPEDYLNANSRGKTHMDSIFYTTNFLWQLAQHAKPCADD